MPFHTSLTEQDWQVRLFVYTFFVEHTRPPSIAETAQHLALSPAAVRESYHQLHQCHHLFLEPGAEKIRMASPLSAAPTPYRVRVNGRDLWANCAWDSLGIPAMLDADALIEARDPLSDSVMVYAVRDGQLDVPSGLMMHFPVPLRRWYDDLIFT